MGNLYATISSDRCSRPRSISLFNFLAQAFLQLEDVLIIGTDQFQTVEVMQTFMPGEVLLYEAGA
jgi:hypothetical protein